MSDLAKRIANWERWAIRDLCLSQAKHLEANAAEIKALKEALQRRGKSALPELAALRAENEKLRRDNADYAETLLEIANNPHCDAPVLADKALNEQALAAVEQSEAGDAQKPLLHDWTDVTDYGYCRRCGISTLTPSTLENKWCKPKGSPDAWIPRI